MQKALMPITFNRQPDGGDSLLALANTLHGPAVHIRPGRSSEAVHDHWENLVEANASIRYLREHNVPLPNGELGPADLSLLRGLREAIWALPGREPDGEWRRRLQPLLATARYRLDADGRLVAVGSGWQRFVASLLPALLGLAEVGPRLRRCANPRCGWLFVDESRNQSRHWCSSRTCGNRDRVNRHRRARRAR
jgi:hypothetical protein